MADHQARKDSDDEEQDGTDGRYGDVNEKSSENSQISQTQTQTEKHKNLKMDSDSTDSELSDLDPKLFENPNVYPISAVQRGQISHHDDFHGKRRYMEIFDTSVDQSNFTVPTGPKKKQYGWAPDKENWNNSISSRDSAIGSTSLFSAYGSVLTDSSSSFESQSNSEDNSSNVSSPIHSVYGRYQKIYTENGDTQKTNAKGEVIETLVLHRLPGENLGMILGIEGGTTGEKFVSKVIVKTVTLGGAAYRASGSSKGIAVGDEILEVNGINLKTLSHDECVTALREMPLRVILSVKRNEKPSPPVSFSPIPRQMQDRSQYRQLSKDSVEDSFGEGFSSFSEGEDDFPEGFTPHVVEIHKDPKESLGISIVPSYGSTRQYYQVKRLLPSGAASRCGKLKVGDRLVTCNGINLRSLAQAQCLGTLKSEGSNGDIELEILRQTENDVPMEISLTVSNGAGFDDSKLTLKSPTSERKDIHLSGLDSGSDSEVVLNKYQSNREVFRETISDDVILQNNFQLIEAKTSQEQLSISDNSDSKKNFFAKQNKNKGESKMDSAADQDQWSFALPPPQEFSDDNEISSAPKERNGEINVPITNIDDILSDYSPSCSNESTPIHQPKPLGNEDQLHQLEELIRLEKDNDISRHHILMPLPESLKEQDTTDDSESEQNGRSIENGGHERINNVYDSFLSPADPKEDKTVYKSAYNKNENIQGQQQRVGYSPPSLIDDQIDLSYLKQKTRESDLHSENKTKGGNSISGYGKTNGDFESSVVDDETVVPVYVKRENAVNLNFKKENVIADSKEIIVPLKAQRENSEFQFTTKGESLPVLVDEEEIIPLSIQRENAPKPSAKNQNVSTEISERDISPPPISRSRPKPAPRKKKSAEPEVSIEEVLVPQKTQKESIEKFVDAKLGGAVTEEEIVPSQADRNWDKVQLVVLSQLSENAGMKKEPEKQATSLFDVAKLAQKKENEVTITSVTESHLNEQSMDNENDVTVSVVSNTLPCETQEIEKDVLLQVEKSDLHSLNTNVNVINDNVMTAVKMDDTSLKLQENVGDLRTNEELEIVDSQRKNLNDIVHVTVISHTESSPDKNVDIKTSESSSDVNTLDNSSVTSPSEHVSVTVVSTTHSEPQDFIKDRAIPEHKTQIEISGSSQTNLDFDPLVNIKSKTNSDSVSKISVQTDIPESRLSESKVEVTAVEVSGSKLPEVEMPPPVPPKVASVKVEPPKSNVSGVDTKYKSSVAVTKPQSILGMIKPQTSTSGQMKPLSTIKPLSINTKSLSLGKPVKYSTTINTGGKTSLLSTLHGSALSSASSTEKTSRSEEEPFQISVLKGILGLGIKVKVTEHGDTQITEIQSSGPIAKDGNLKVGDYMLSINSTELGGLSDSKVQQILRLLPRGLAKIVASAKPPSGRSATENTKATSGGKPQVGELNIKTDTDTSKSLSSPISPAGVRVSARPYSAQISPTIKSVSPVIQKSPPRPEKPEATKLVDEKTSTEVLSAPSKVEVTKDDGKSVKQSPPVPPKPKPSSFFDSIKEPALETSKKSVGGYVGSALGQKKTFFEKKSQPDQPSYASSLPHKPTSYVSSAERITTHEDKSQGKKETEDKGPIDTVIFASMSGHKPDHETSAGKLSESSSKNADPRIIPSGQVDYVSSKPKSPRSPKSPDSPLSPREKAEQMASKFITDRKSLVINPQRLNSALSPKQKSDSNKSKFGFSEKPTKLHTEDDKAYSRSSQKHTGKGDNLLVSPTEHSPITDDSPSQFKMDTDLDSRRSPLSQDNIISLQYEVSVEAELVKNSDENEKPPHFEMDNTDIPVVHPENVVEVSDDKVVSSDEKSEEEMKVAKQLVDEVITSAVKYVESDSSDEKIASEIVSEVSADIEFTDPVSSPQAVDANLSDSNLVGFDTNMETALTVESKPLVDSDVNVTASNKSLMADDIPVGGKSSFELDASVEVMHEKDEGGETNLNKQPANLEQTNNLDLQNFSDQDVSVSEEAPLLPSAPPPPLAIPVATNIASDMVMDSLENSESKYKVDDVDFDPLSPTKSNVLNQDKSELADMGSPDMVLPPSGDSYNNNITSETLNLQNEQLIACDVSPQNSCMPPSCELSSHNAPLLPACSDDVVVTKTSLPLSTESDRSKELQEFVETEVVDPFSIQDNQGSTDLLQEPVKPPDLLNNQSVIVDAENVDVNMENVDSVNSLDVLCDERNTSNIVPVNNDATDVYSENTDIHISNEQKNIIENPFDIKTDIYSQQYSVINTLKVKDGADTPDTKSVGSLDDLSDSEFAMVTSRRRWSLVMGQQELNMFSSNRSTPLSFDSNVSNGGLISPDQLSALLDKANETMDQTGMSEEDEIMVVILHKEDSATAVGLKLCPGDKQQVIVAEIDPEGLVAKDGRIHVGYNILSLNGETLNPEKLNKVTDTLNNIHGQVVLVVSKSADCSQDEMSPQQYESQSSEPQIPASEPVCDIPEIQNPENVDSVDSLQIEVSVDSQGETVDCELASTPKEKVLPVIESEVQNSNADVKSSELSNQEHLQVSSGTVDKEQVQSSSEGSNKEQVSMNTEKQNDVTVTGSVVELNGQNQSQTTNGEPDVAERTGVFEVTMIKGHMGLGFLIEGGKSTPLGDLPLTIKRIIKGGPAEKCGQLKVKDEILSVNGEDITDMRHKEAWTFLKFLDDGDVKLLIKRGNTS